MQSDNGREFNNEEINDEVIEMWPGLKIVNGKSNIPNPRNLLKELTEMLKIF